MSIIDRIEELAKTGAIPLEMAAEARRAYGNLVAMGSDPDVAALATAEVLRSKVQGILSAIASCIATPEEISARADANRERVAEALAGRKPH